MLSDQEMGKTTRYWFFKMDEKGWHADG